MKIELIKSKNLKYKEPSEQDIKLAQEQLTNLWATFDTFQTTLNDLYGKYDRRNRKIYLPEGWYSPVLLDALLEQAINPWGSKSDKQEEKIA